MKRQKNNGKQKLEDRKKKAQGRRARENQKISRYTDRLLKLRKKKTLVSRGCIFLPERVVTRVEITRNC